LQGPGFHPKWKDVTLNAKVPGLDRFPAAQEWLDSSAASRVVAASSGIGGGAGSAPPGTMAIPATPQEQRLYQEFLEWRRQHGK
jgi:hypothetical protein